MLLLAACIDATLSVSKDPPTVTLLEPGEGASFYAETPLVFRAVGGPEPSVLDYAFWVGDRGTVAGELVRTDEGAVWTLADGLPAGDYTASVTVVDAEGLSGEDQVTFQVVDNGPPVVTIVAPVEGSTLACRPVSFVAFLSDPEHAVTDLALAYAGLPEGTPAPSSPGEDGYVTFDADGFVEGEHTFTLTATDPAGASGGDAATFVVAACVPDECNGVDDDGDGAVDEDAEATAWYRDADGDGHGDPASRTDACAAPEGFVAAGDDCDDADGTAWPGAAEVCDGDDEDCDGEVDEDTGYWLVGLPERGELWRIEQGGSAPVLFASGLGSISALEVGSRLWVAQWDDPVVRSLALDGTDARSIVNGYSGGQGVAVDESAGLLFWGAYYGDLWVGDPAGASGLDLVIDRTYVQAAIGSSYDGIGIGLEADAATETLYFFTRSNAGFAGRWILRVDYRGGNLEALRNVETACMDYDRVGGKVYFADTVSGVQQMWRMNGDGTDAEPLFDLHDGAPCSGVRVDGAADSLTYLQSATGTVWTARLDGADHVELASGLVNNQGLAWVDCPS